MSVLTGTTLEATYSDIEALPPNMVGEILDGQLVASPRSAGPHATAASSLGALLNVLFERGLGGPGGWWITYEPELSLDVDPSYDPVVPDIAGWRRQRMPAACTTAQYHVTPDWICEVLSPSTMRNDRMLKLPFYARAAVKHLWLVDPLNHYIEVFELKDGAWVLTNTVGDDDVVCLAPFADVEIDLAPLWGHLRPDEKSPDS